MDDSLEEGQALGDAQQDEIEVEVLLSGWQGGRGPELGDAKQDESEDEVFLP
jgi:hypothetical protein